MGNFVLRRLVLSLPVLIGIIFVTFSLARLIPGDPCTAILGEKATQQVCDAFKERVGLNKPIPIQFGLYFGDILRGDLGDSIRFGQPVSLLLVQRLPVTIELATIALLFAVVVGVPLGIISAYRYNSPLDFGTMLGANVGVSMPVFWLGLMLAYFFAVILKGTPLALPPSGQLTPGANFVPFYQTWGLAVNEKTATGLMIFLSRMNFINALLTLNGQQFIDAARHMILPAIAVGTIPLSIVARMTRSSVLESLSQDYVRTARAKGLSEFVVISKHAVRNALLPVVTIIGLNFGGLLGGAVLTETIFGFGGIGKTLFDGISSRDYAVVQGVTLITAFAFVAINLLVDILYGYLDPRIRLS
jgi:peptide/nickel transport system permease protein